MKTFEGFPHIGERFGHYVKIVMQADKSRCDFVAFEVVSLEENEVGLLERTYRTNYGTIVYNPEISEQTMKGFVNFDGTIHVDIAPSRKGYLCLVGTESVKDFAGLLIWTHAKCMELLEGK